MSSTTNTTAEAPSSVAISVTRRWKMNEAIGGAWSGYVCGAPQHSGKNRGRMPAMEACPRARADNPAMPFTIPKDAAPWL